MTEKYGRTLLGLLVNSKQRNSPIYDDIIMLSSKDDFLERFVDFTKELTGKYTEQGVDSQIRRYLLDSPLLFNMILIDEKHAVITYPFIRETHTAQAGYCFVDKPEIVKDLASWFDLILVSNALSATSVSDIPQIIGTWVGEFDHNGTYYTEEIHVKEQYGDCVLGTFNSPNPDNPKIVYLYNFEGHFIGHRVLVGALKPSAGNSQIEGHGSFILKLNGEGNEFSGKSIGISIVNSTIESRTYRAKKQM